MPKAWHINKMNNTELSEKLKANIARESVECNAPFLGVKEVSLGVIPAVDGVGSVSSSTSSFEDAFRGSVSDKY